MALAVRDVIGAATLNYTYLVDGVRRWIDAYGRRSTHGLPHWKAAGVRQPYRRAQMFANIHLYKAIA
jgi:hypothetical protein